MRNHLLVFALLTLLCMAGSIAFAQSGPTFPPLSARVVDQAGILDASAEKVLTEQLTAHETQTSNQIIVVTVNSLEGYADADYALQLGREWGIGTEEKNNGVILLVAPNERKVRIEVGYGLEGALPDGLAGQIIRRNILPSFKESDFSGGIQSGVNAILQAVVGEYKAEPASSRNRSRQNEAFGFMPLFFIGMVAVPALLRTRGLKRAANAAFPGGFAGLAATVLSGNFIIGILIGIAAFGAMYHFNPNMGNGGGRGGMGGRYGGGTGGSIGGGFSGGGGGFGGGGASGSW